MMPDSDHRSIGQRLDLFHLQEEAPGMVFWHPRGHVLVRLLEEALRRHMARQDIVEVRTPQLLRQPIWESSGHWAHFRDAMFVLDADDEGQASAIKPVSCPGHLQLVARLAPSYRDLPLRIGELGLVHRNERSGSLHGLFRLRQFTQDDGHIVCAPDQVAAEVDRFVRELRAFYAGFGFDRVEVAFSDRPAGRAGDDALWDQAEAALRDAARAAGLDAAHQPGQGAFYGPKLEFALHDRLGRAWQCGTIQLDLVLPGRFGVHYVDASGARRQPVMLHRATLGSLERFLGVLLEHHEGHLPAWLAPEQVRVASIVDAQAPWARRVRAALVEAGLRASLDERGDTIARKIAGAASDAVPLVAVVGRREAERGAVTLRERDGRQRELPLEAAAGWLREQCRPPV